ncbi:type IV secretory system conjugative DNA transfer family protein [Paraburkholderia aromaticivorans]|uniref:hypothetical protein n=1 Tax=Paraburkholderia aromaticivorans TaxID=2026199 RepID=UPI0038BC4DC3
MRNLKIIRHNDNIAIEPAPLSLSLKTLLSYRLEEKGLDSLSRIDRFATINRHQTGELNITFGDGTKNILVLGGTGEGKTDTTLLPAFNQLVTHGCTGITLDIKSGFEQEARSLKAQGYNIMLLGASTDSVKCNIIAGLGDSKLRDFLESITEPLRLNNKYWGSTGIEDAMMIARFIRATTGYDANLADLYYYLANPRDFVALVENNRLHNDDQRFRRMVRELDAHLATYQFCFLKAGGYKGTSLDRGFSDNDGRNQFEWQVGQLRSALKPFFENPVIREHFCATDAVDFQKLIYEENAVLVMNVPYSIYGEISFTIAKMLRARYYDAVKGMKEPKLKAMGYGREKFTFMLIDEYQQFIEADRDNDWFDSSRGYGNINIVSMQSATSAMAKATNQFEVQTIIQNCRNVICYATNDSNTVSMMQNLFSSQGIDPRMIADLLIHPIGNHVLVYQGRQVESRVANQGICETAMSSMEVMNRFLKPQGFIDMDYTPESVAALTRSHVRYDRNRSVMTLNNPFPDLNNAEAYQHDWDDALVRATTGQAQAIFDLVAMVQIHDMTDPRVALTMDGVRAGASIDATIKILKTRRDTPKAIREKAQQVMESLPDCNLSYPMQPDIVYRAFNELVKPILLVCDRPGDDTALRDYMVQLAQRYHEIAEKEQPDENFLSKVVSTLWADTGYQHPEPAKRIEDELDEMMQFDDEEEVNVFIDEKPQEEQKPEKSDEWNQANEKILCLLDKHGADVVRKFLQHVKECFLPFPLPDEKGDPFNLTLSEIEKINLAAGCSPEEAKQSAQATMEDLQKLTKYPTSEFPRISPEEYIVLTKQLTQQLDSEEDDDEE